MAVAFNLFGETLGSNYRVREHIYVCTYIYIKYIYICIYIKGSPVTSEMHTERATVRETGTNMHHGAPP